MSPIGSVGINLAAQDAIAAANRLSQPLQRGQVRLADLAAIQRQREGRTRLVQAWIGFIQRQIVGALNARKPFRLPPIAQMVLRFPLVRSIPARIVAFGGWPEHLNRELHATHVPDEMRAEKSV
jgi:2-polyprenyl-6-methoxyphenol hydroxylase-like FAD-dependent oxidoreductase